MADQLTNQATMLECACTQPKLFGCKAFTAPVLC